MNSISQNDELVQKLYRRYRTLLESYSWEWEEDRWRELVFCLLWHFGGHSDVKTRTAVRILGDLNLLHVADLAALASDGNDVDMSQTQATLIAEVLRRCGFDDHGIAHGLGIVVQAAQSLENHYQGKIQLYLRAYGERILAELPQHFAFTNATEEDIRYAFSVWLQNTLNMPVPAWDERVDRFCQQFNISQSELLCSADNQDLNVAVLDDLIERYMDEQTEDLDLIEEEEL